LKGKPKENTQIQVQAAPVNKVTPLKAAVEQERGGKFVRVPLTLLERNPDAVSEAYEDLEG